MNRLDLSDYKKFILPYWISNGGDGSVSLHLSPTLEQAKASDNHQYEGWGESSASTISIYEKDGRLFYTKIDWHNKPYREYLVEIKQ